jgi:hypothetical protein
MANSNDVKRALAGDRKLFNANLRGTKSLKGANLSGADLRWADLRYSSLRGTRFRGASLKRAKLRASNLIDAKITNADLSYADLSGAFLERADLTRSNLYNANLTDADLTDAKGIPLYVSDKFPHKGETVEEKARREEEERLRREEEKARREEEKARKEAIQDITRRVSRAKGDKELEALAQEVGSLQAQPDYVREYKRDLEDLQAEIEKKYSVVGKGIRYLKRLVFKGRRASQIRVASQMNLELQREIKALKRNLNR